MDNYYRIALLDIALQEAWFRFSGLRPFLIEKEDVGDLILNLYYKQEVRPVTETMRLIDCFDFPDADAECRLYGDTDGYLFVMTERASGKQTRFDLPLSGIEAFCNFAAEGNPALFRFGLWIAYNLRAAERGVLAIHASVLTYRNGAVLCLGESGTGKSTHTRLWREHIEGAELLNDDSPMLRIVDGVATVFGSPWSGKTPCYRNLHYPIRGFMRLSQAPVNEIRPLSVLQAYGALQPSLPPSFAHDERLFDRVNALLSALLQRVKAYHLRCLPNREAAELARDTIFQNAMNDADR